MKLITVHHTGSQFFARLIAAQLGPPAPLKGEGAWYFDHCWPHKRELIESKPGPLVTTRRNWDAVEASWQRRGRDMDEYRTEREAWETWVLPNADCIVSVENRDTLEDLSALLGVTLQTDWKPVNQAPPPGNGR